MEEYYIGLGKSENLFDKIHLYHKDIFTKDKIEEIVKDIYQKSLKEAPRVIEENVFKHYLEYNLLNDYGFVSYYAKERYYYDLNLDEIIK